MFEPPKKANTIAGHRLTAVEVAVVEDVLEMGGGYVLHFSNRTLGDFFAGFDVNIYDEKYNEGGGSKANRLRSFLRQSPAPLVVRVLRELLEIRAARGDRYDETLDKFRRIIAKVEGGVEPAPAAPSAPPVSGAPPPAPAGVTPLLYDVTLSFAGEDRPAAEVVASACKARSINVFYDRYETASLWGKDLYQHLADVYSHQARYCLVFVSAHYVAKLWTNHELKAAQTRAFREGKEYILPIRMDATSLPGLNETTGYIEWAKHTPDEIVAMLEVKLGRTPVHPRVRKSSSRHASKIRSTTSPARQGRFERWRVEGLDPGEFTDEELDFHLYRLAEEDFHDSLSSSDQALEARLQAERERRRKS
jgi:hypothetical protein